MTEAASSKILACWRCRRAKLLPKGESYWCPSCQMPVCEEDVLGAWRGVKEEEIRSLTPDAWDGFIRSQELGGDDQALLGTSCGRSFSWGFVSLRELRKYVDQGRRISWLDPLTEDGEDN